MLKKLLFLCILLSAFFFSSCSLFKDLFFGPLYILTVEIDSSELGAVIVTAERENESDIPGEYAFRENTVVTLEAVPAEGNSFHSWSDDTDDLTTTLTLIEDSSVTALFLGQKDWTVLVYLDGDNNLEGAAIEDFKEMEYGLYLAQEGDSDILNKLSVIVQFDRGTYSDSDLDGIWGETRRYKILPDSNPSDDVFKSIRLENLGELNMGDAGTLKDFIVAGKRDFPADNYALILWNHGSGARSISDPGEQSGSKAICEDETSNNDVLYTGEITDILSDSEDVDLLGFDACLMSIVEVAYEYRPESGKFGASYMAASPANEQGDGWEYDKIFARFAGSGKTDTEGDDCYNVTTLTPEEFANIIVKEYSDYFSSRPTETMTSLDLSETPAVKTALDLLAVELADMKTQTEILRGSESSPVTMEYFNEEIEGEWLFWPDFDLYDFAERISVSGSFDAEAKSAAINLMSAVDNCVLSSWAGSNYNPDFEAGKNGLAFFFPDGDRTYGVSTDHHYWYQWWYTAETTNDWWSGGHYYGKIDFCAGGNINGSVESWRELLESWFDNGANYTPGSW